LVIGLGISSGLNAQPAISPDAYSPVTNINANGFPKVLPDNSVVFKVNAPDATTVQIDLGGKKWDGVRDEKGVWTIVSGPQAPGFHYYSLVTDGVSTADPASESFYGCSRMSSAVDILEKGADLFEIQDVPHGQLRYMNYYSKEASCWRPLIVYTPADYEDGSNRYPVVYIHHGGGEDHRGWAQQGRVGTILDNLIAAGKAVPMIIVCVNSNMPRTTNTPASSGSGWGSSPSYSNELIDNIVPFVDASFRTVADASHRAICGLSMGGGNSFNIGLNNPEVFANVGVFSSGMFGGVSGPAAFDAESSAPGIYSDTDHFNSLFDHFYITCGEQDPRINFTKAAAEQMQQKGVKLEFESFPGDHEWQPWRKSVAAFTQKLFK